MPSYSREQSLNRSRDREGYTHLIPGLAVQCKPTRRGKEEQRLARRARGSAFARRLSIAAGVTTTLANVVDSASSDNGTKNFSLYKVFPRTCQKVRGKIFYSL